MAGNGFKVIRSYIKIEVFIINTESLITPSNYWTTMTKICSTLRPMFGNYTAAK